VRSLEHKGLSSIEKVRKTLLSQVEQFFISYNEQRGKKFKVIGIAAPKQALKYLKGECRPNRKPLSNS
jgi:inorganic pyrophosphatase